MRGLVVVCATLLVVACGHGATGAPRYTLKQVDGPGGLFLIGGGDDSPPLLRRFIALAGGNDAPIAVVPDAGGAENGALAQTALRAQGAMHVTVLTGDVSADGAVIGDASALYFVGGYADHLMQKFAPSLAAARGAWRAGCLVGGSSAGAMVWGSQVVLSGETANALAHGVDAAHGGLGVGAGLGLLPGTIVDPHFLQRGRFDRLAVAAAATKTLGIGIDEQTAAYLPPTGPMQVFGMGAVTLIKPEGGTSRVQVLPAGSTLDLSAWRTP